jgi:chaperonin cofactor prefoldin
LATAQTEMQNYDGALATIRQGLTVEANNPQLTKQMRTIKQIKKSYDARQQSQARQASSAGGLPGSHAKLDAAASKELQDLQQQYGLTSRELGLVQSNLVKVQRESKVADLTKSELVDLPKDARCYRSIGKMFRLTTQDQAVEYMDKQMADCQKKEGEMTQRLEYLERRLKSQRQNMEELTHGAAE